MEFVIDESGTLCRCIPGGENGKHEDWALLCPKMTRSIKKKGVIFCGLDCSLFSLLGYKMDGKYVVRLECVSPAITHRIADMPEKFKK